MPFSGASQAKDQISHRPKFLPARLFSLAQTISSETQINIFIKKSRGDLTDRIAPELNRFMESDCWHVELSSAKFFDRLSENPPLF